MTLYFAYGSNLNKKQMRLRCPAAMPLGKITVPDIKLVFRRFLDIDACEGSSVDGALWEITDHCEHMLDTYEGVRYSHYEKLNIEYEGKELLSYSMVTKDEPFPPPARYVRDVLRGCRDFGIDQSAIRTALREAWLDFGHVSEECMKRFDLAPPFPFAAE